MKNLWVIAALLAGCATTAPTPSPDPVIPSPVPAASIEPLKKALSDFFSRVYLSATFKGAIVVGGGAPLEHSGRVRYYENGIMMLDVTSSGNRQIRAMRLGTKSWAFHDAVEDWVNGEECGLGDLGKGYQNPIELIESMQASIGGFRLAGREGNSDVYEMTATGSLLDSAFRPLIKGMAVDAAASRLQARLLVEGTVLREARVGGFLMTVPGGGAPIRVDGEASVALGPPGEAAPPMKFNDVPVPFNEEMKTSIRKLQEQKK